MIRLRSHSLLLASAALAGLLAAGCGKSLSADSVFIDAGSGTVGAGHTLALTAYGRLSNGTTAPLLEVAWTTSDAATATVSGAGIITGRAAGTATITAAAEGHTATASITVTPAVLVSIVATPSPLSLAIAQSQQLAVTGTFDNGSTGDVTATAAYASSNATVATVTAAGLVKGLAAGSATVTVALAGKSVVVPVTVLPATLNSIAVVPATISLKVGAKQGLTVTGSYSDGTTADLTTSAVYVAQDPTVATVTSPGGGLVTAVKAGTTKLTITVTAGAVTKTASATVTVPAPVSMTVTPATVALKVAGPSSTQQLAVTGVFADASTIDLTSSASFASADATVATVSTAGLVTAKKPGSTTVTVSVPGLPSATLAVTVAAPVLQSIAVTPTSFTVTVGVTQQLAVSGTYDVGAPQDLTGSATYTSLPTGIVSISSSGLVTGVKAGNTTITVAVAGAASVTATATVAGLVSIAAAPTSVTLKQFGPQSSQQLTITGTLADNSTLDLTARSTTTYTSSDPTVVTVSTPGGGLITAVKPGSATITVSAPGVADATVAITVVAPVLQSIAATPSPLSFNLTPAGTQQLTLTGTYDVGPTKPLTASATYSSSPTGIVTISAGGLVTAVAAGTTTITVAVTGVTSATVPVTVAALQSLAVTPNPINLNLTPAGTQQLTVTGTYNVGPTKDLTGIASYSSVPGGVVTISSGGMVTAVGAGSTTITASVTPTGGAAVAGTTSVTVTSNVVNPALVFYAGAYAANVAFLPFTDSANFANSTNVTPDTTTLLTGTAHGSLKITLAPAGKFTGGALIDNSGPRDLHTYDALTFWAKASAALTFDHVGIGNNAGFSSNAGYDVEEFSLPLTTTWTKFIVPIPLASKLTAVDGLFHFADGVNSGSGQTVWLADIQYETLGSSVIGTPTPAWKTTTKTVSKNGTYNISAGDLKVDYSTGAPFSSAVELVNINPNYFTFTSDSAVVTVAGSVLTGANTTGSDATANITAKLGTVSSSNKLVVTSQAVALPVPTALPTVPTKAAGAGVVALWSSRAAPNGYFGTPSDYSANIDFHNFATTPTGDPVSVTVGPTTFNPRLYNLAGNGDYAGIGFFANPINAAASCLDTLHVDVWTPDFATVVGAVFKVSLVDFASGGGVPKEVQIFPSGNPAMLNNAWNSYDLKLSTAFGYGSSLPTQLQQAEFVAVSATTGGHFYVDNWYLYNSASTCTGPSGPAAAAPTPPVRTSGNVVSLYNSSGTYTNVPVDTWQTSWSVGTLTSYTIPSTSSVVKQYTGVQYVGVEFLNPGPHVDAHLMDTMHVDLWTPNATQFSVKLVGFSGSTAGAEFQVNYTSSTIKQNQWVSLDIPLSSFTGVDLSNIGQMLLVDNTPNVENGTFFIDNVYFYKTPPTSPSAPAPTPSKAAANVVSLFNSSGTYTNVPVDTWQTGWSVGTLTQFTIPGSSRVVNKYAGVQYVGVEFLNPGPHVDAHLMSTLHVDLWTPNATQFSVKLVGFAGSTAGAEFQVNYTSSTIHQAQWISLDIPLSSFTGVDLSNIGQLLWVDNTPLVENGTFFIDNVYFWK